MKINCLNLKFRTYQSRIWKNVKSSQSFCEIEMFLSALSIMSVSPWNILEMIPIFQLKRKSYFDEISELDIYDIYDRQAWFHLKELNLKYQIIFQEKEKDEKRKRDRKMKRNRRRIDGKMERCPVVSSKTHILFKVENPHSILVILLLKGHY